MQFLVMIINYCHIGARISAIAGPQINGLSASKVEYCFYMYSNQIFFCRDRTSVWLVCWRSMQIRTHLTQGSLTWKHNVYILLWTRSKITLSVCGAIKFAEFFNHNSTWEDKRKWSSPNLLSTKRYRIFYANQSPGRSDVI